MKGWRRRAGLCALWRYPPPRLCMMKCGQAGSGTRLCRNNKPSSSGFPWKADTTVALVAEGEVSLPFTRTDTLAFAAAAFAAAVW